MIRWFGILLFMASLGALIAFNSSDQPPPEPNPIPSPDQPDGNPPPTLPPTLES